MCFESAFKKIDRLAFEEWKKSHVSKLNYSGSAGNMEPVCAKRIWEHSLQKKNYDILQFMVVVTAKAFQLLKIHIQALQSKDLNVYDMFRNKLAVVCEI